MPHRHLVVPAGALFTHGLGGHAFRPRCRAGEFGVIVEKSQMLIRRAARTAAIIAACRFETPTQE